MVLCVTPPLVPVTAIVVVPFLAFLAAVMVMTDDPVPGAGMGFGLKLTVTRLPCPEADNEIAELKPLKAAVLMFEVPELPRATVSEVGEALMLKFGGGLVTVTLAVPLTLPLAAVTVKGPPAVEPAVNSPEALMVPPPLTDQLNVGWGLIGLPN